MGRGAVRPRGGARKLMGAGIGERLRRGDVPRTAIGETLRTGRTGEGAGTIMACVADPTGSTQGPRKCEGGMGWEAHGAATGTVGRVGLGALCIVTGLAVRTWTWPGSTAADRLPGAAGGGGCEPGGATAEDM
mmetsp:Transcript_101366/g.302282  ORF Transcript_101366/g.302282 Transcript_101366/m.302282 type:complete len:133 (-) Transcript_101366:88-486(-)